MKNKLMFAACWLLLAIVPLISCTQPAKVRTPSNAPPVANSNTSPEPQREERLVIAYQGEDGKTALELLKARARVRTSTSQIGEMVEEINGVSTGNGYHLIYFVNGAMAKTGAAEYRAKTGDRIEWKLIGPRNPQKQ